MNMIDARFKGTLGAFFLDAAFACPARGVTGLFGPSGSGKTTILRCLAGLTRIGEGYLAVDGEVWQDGQRFLASHRRSVGYVFQDARLFPHLSVLGNLNFALSRAGSGRRAIELEAMVDLMGIGGLLQRAPLALSGGERQRVAIARALLSQPRLLLMDEPLSALDRHSKDEILPYLEKLPKGLSIPIIYVSHDVAEIERLADHLILMSKDGRVLASGPLTDLLTDLTLPLARLPEAASVLSVAVEQFDSHYDLTVCSIGGQPFVVPGDLGPKGTLRRIRVRAGDVSLLTKAPEGTSVLNVLPASIVSGEATGTSQMLVLLSLEGSGGEVRLVSSITRKSWDRLGLCAGKHVFAQIKGMALVDAL